MNNGKQRHTSFSDGTGCNSHGHGGFGSPWRRQRREALLKIHRMLRGKYKWAILLSAVVGAASAYAGFRMGLRTYQETGVIEVLPSEKTVLYRIDDKGALPDFTAYVDAQVALIKSQRVMDHVMENPAWLALGQKKSDDSILAFAKNLEVVKQDSMIWVKSTDPDPQTAMTFVNVVIAAYEQVYHEQEIAGGEPKGSCARI